MAICRSEVSNAPLLRLEGQAELVGDLQFACNSNSSVPFDVTVTLSVPVATPFAGATLQVSSPSASYTPVLDGPNRVRFTGVSLPAGTPTTLRITGLRANISGLPYSLAATPPVVSASVAAVGYPLAAPQVPVGYPSPSYTVALRTANGTPATVLNLAASTTERSHELVFRESFPSAFQTRAREANATQGTRLVAQFTNLPPGAAIAVAPLSGPSAARLIAAESGPYSEVPFSPFVPLPISNGTATAVWEVLADDPTRLETYGFGLIASGPSVSAAVTGRLGPVDQTSLPRFVASAALAPVDCAVPCVLAPRALHFTRRFGQPPPASFVLPYFSDIGTSQFELRVVLDSPYQWLTAPGPGPTLQFSDAPLPPGRYTAYVETLPGGHATWIVLNVLPALPGAATPLLCAPGGGVPSVIRAEGMAEPVSAIQIACSGGVPGSFVTTTISGSLNTYFASRILDEVTSRSETLLTIGDPAAPTPGVNEFSAVRTDFFGRFEFRNVTFQVPSSGSVTLWISNLRVEGNYLAGLGDSFSDPNVELSLTATGNLGMPATKFPIGIVQPGVEFDVRNAAGEFVNRITTPGSYVLRFREGSATAFRRLNVATSVDNPSAVADQGPVSNQFFTESMNFRASRGISGLATQGTRLQAAIRALPRSSRVFVTVSPLSSSSRTAHARLTRNELEPFSAAPISNSAPLFLGSALPMAEVAGSTFPHIVSWEVLGSNPFQVEQVEFGLVVSEADGTDGAITGSFGPSQQPQLLTYPRFLAPVTTGRRTPSCSSSDCPYFEGSLWILQAPNSPDRRRHSYFLRTRGATFRYHARSDAAWLIIPEPIGVAPNSSFTFITDPAGLAPGVYRTTMRINETAIPVVFQIPGPQALTVHASPISSSAPNQRTIQLTATHHVNASRFDVINILVNSALDGRNACYLAYSLSAGALFLVNDAGPEAGLSAPLVLGSNAEIANSQCRVRGATSSVTLNGPTLGLILDLTFDSAWTGSKSVFLAARAAENASTGWLHFPPIHLSESILYPRVLPGVTRTNLNLMTNHVFVYEDATHANNLETVWGLINTAVDARGACYFAYYVPGNLLFLYPDDGNGAEAKSILLAGNRSLSNSQCTIVAAGAEVRKSGRQLILSLPILTLPPFDPAASPVQRGIWGAAKSLTSPAASSWRILDLYYD